MKRIMAKENVKPTRMELLLTKQRLVLAEKGHKILKQKRDALVLEFFAIVKKAADLRRQVDEAVLRAYGDLAIAAAFHGELALETAALASEQAPGLRVTSKNIMGVRIPALEGVHVERSLRERGYSIEGSSAKLDETVASFEATVQAVLRLAETESALERLLTEIEKTNRRVNALEFNIQPDLRATVKEIAQRLNQLENERFSALKVTKRRLRARAEAEELELEQKILARHAKKA